MDLNKKVLFITAFALMCALPLNAEELEDVSYPKQPAYRVGLSEIPENQYVQAQQIVQTEKKYAPVNGVREDNIASRTYADLSIKNLSREVAMDLEFEEQEMLSDLSLLWQGAAMQSDTINFALYKLANPDADKPDEKSIKNVLKTIASMSTLVGASMGNPILAGSSLIGGNIFGIMSQDTKALNYKYTKVTDADMIILIRKIEDLQQNAVNLYYDYMSAKKHLDFTTKLVEENRRKFELAQQNNAARELVVITDAYYRTALDKQRTAKSEFFAKRAALEQFVGNETFVQFEEELLARENAEQNNMDNIEEASEQSIDSTVANDVQSIESGVAENLPVIDNVDEKLVDIPVLRPFEMDVNTATEFGNGGFMTGLSSNIDNVQESKLKKSDIRKAKKQQKKDDKKAAKTQAKVEKLEAKQKAIDEKAIAKEKREEERLKAIEKRKDPTKGLIFLHGQDKSTFTSNRLDQTQSGEVPVSSSIEIPPIAPGAYTPAPNPYGLPPLDEIRVPELSRGGYSIHSELPY